MVDGCPEEFTAPTIKTSSGASREATGCNGMPSARSPGPVRVDAPFSATFTHRLRFTDDVLGADQHVLAEVLEPTEGRPAAVQFWLDCQVATAQSGLARRLVDFSQAHADRFRAAGEVEVVPGGETIKNEVHLLEHILRSIHSAGLDRRSYVIVIGGGAVLDAVGFAAAIAHRGIRLVRLPTTTLGQADSGVRVKNGVNLFGKKNWLGSFAVPWSVINDAALLATLPDREFIAGFSEAVKVSLLKSPALFEDLCRSAARVRRRDIRVGGPLIRASAMLHLEHITRGGDPFEMLEARPLDFGHWSAHRLEALTDYRLRHGEAVAIGVAIDTIYSTLALGLPRPDAERVLRCLIDLGFRLDDPSLDDTDSIFDGLEEFRQHLGGRLTLTLLRGVGDPFEVHEINCALMREAIAVVRRTSTPVSNPVYL